MKQQNQSDGGLTSGLEEVQVLVSEVRQNVQIRGGQGKRQSAFLGFIDPLKILDDINRLDLNGSHLFIGLDSSNPLIGSVIGDSPENNQP